MLFLNLTSDSIPHFKINRASYVEIRASKNELYPMVSVLQIYDL